MIDLNTLTADSLSNDVFKEYIAILLKKYNTLLSGDNLTFDDIKQYNEEIEQLQVFLNQIRVDTIETQVLDLEAYQTSLDELKLSLETLISNINDSLANGDFVGEQGVQGISKDGFKNFIINGCFRIWQRSEDFTTNQDNIYGFADRFKTWTNSNMKITKINDGIRLEVLSANTTGYIGLRQDIEDMSKFDGQQFTVSAKVKTNIQGVGFRALGSTQNQFPNDENYNFDSVTFLFDSSDSTIGLLSYPNAPIDLKVGDYIEIKEMQLELGDTATDFEYRPLAIEEILCKRYFQKNSLEFVNNISSNYNGVSFPLPTNMRVNPTKQIFSSISNVPGKIYCQDMASDIDSVIEGDNSFFNVYTNNFSTNVGSRMQFYYTLDAEL